MIYAVIKDNTVISFLLNESQIDFLQEQDNELVFTQIDVEWDVNNPLQLSNCVVGENNAVIIQG